LLTSGKFIWQTAALISKSDAFKARSGNCGKSY
jgi:hypothetical protein